MDIQGHPLDLPYYVGWSKTDFRETMNGKIVVRVTAHAGLDESGDIGFRDAFEACLIAVQQYASEIEPFATVTTFEFRALWLDGKGVETYRNNGQTYLKFSERESLEFD